eukprot:TRINITY_DN758_c0_g2_i1.p1 TRINITY_DN758_c0_g2~~TRINITY_DN758_c0_g2_i1.p1  ORF type:complete len:341 (-),score=109.71 TRINITY_DN758_c0_g2_i1:51-1073(-)
MFAIQIDGSLLLMGLRTIAIPTLSLTKSTTNAHKTMANNNTNAHIDPHLRLVSEMNEFKPPLRNKFDAISLLLHLAMKSFGFRCVGSSESSRDETNSGDFAPEGWNSSNDSYTFTYKHSKSSMVFVVKALVMGDSLLVNGLALEDKKVHSMEVHTNDYVIRDAKMDEYSNLFKNLQELLNEFKAKVVDKLLPGLNKEGYQAPSESSNTTADQNQRRDPLREDPYRNDPLRVPNSGGYGRPYGSGPAFGMGDRDLYPDVGGFNIPSIPGMGPGGYGSHMGPDHPGFGSLDPYRGEGGGLGRGNPRPPPGARFDPFGPPGNFFGGPNPDDLNPPGFGGNMYL